MVKIWAVACVCDYASREAIYCSKPASNNNGPPSWSGSPIPQRDRHGFVSLRLNPGWRLERRVYQGKPLNHLYFAHREPLNRLLAMTQPNRPSGLNPLGNPIAPPPLQPLALGGNPIRLEVIPFRPSTR